MGSTAQLNVNYIFEMVILLMVTDAEYFNWEIVLKESF